jgi:hypothetical protein
MTESDAVDFRLFASDLFRIELTSIETNCKFGHPKIKTMRYHKDQFVILLIAALLTSSGCNAQNGSEKKRLTLEKEIAMPNVKGRIDHIDINWKDQVVYIAALGNNTVEIIA